MKFSFLLLFAISSTAFATGPGGTFRDVYGPKFHPQPSPSSNKNPKAAGDVVHRWNQIAIDATELGFAWHARRRAPANAAAAAAYDAACMRLAGLFPVMLAFLLGTAAGTIAYVSVGSWGLLVPVALMYGAFVWASTGRGAD